MAEPAVSGLWGLYEEPEPNEGNGDGNDVVHEKNDPVLIHGKLLSGDDERLFFPVYHTHMKKNTRFLEFAAIIFSQFYVRNS